MYSIASDPLAYEIEVLYNIVPQGEMSKLLSRCKAGTTLYCSAPFGTFTGTNQPAYYIATGTGIAPYMSMLAFYRHDNKWLVHGSRTDENLYFSSALQRKLNSRYVPCLSVDNENVAYSGRITDYLSAHPALPVNVVYYLCGNAEMVVEVRDLLLQKGISFDKIRAEIYF
jgi:ferredoxin--NADP+ reductase